MIIVRYLTREILYTFSLVTIILVMAFLSQQVVRYLNYVAVGKVSSDILLQLITFEIPYLVALLAPLGLYLGILLSYGRAYMDNEMSILAMSGFNTRRLLRLTLIVACVIAYLILILMLLVNPWISARRQHLLASDAAAYHLIKNMVPGRFQESPDGKYVMYVEKMSSDRERSENVFLAQEKKLPDAPQAAWMLVFAKLGFQMQDKLTKDQFFITADGERYEGTPGQNDYKIIQFKKYAVRIPQNKMSLPHEENESLSTSALLQGYQNPKHAAEFQWRISIAISAILLALLAIPLSSAQPRQSRYLVLLPAVLIYIVYVNLLFIARHWVEQKTVSITMGMWWPHFLMLFFIISFVFIKNKAWKTHTK